MYHQPWFNVVVELKLMISCMVRYLLRYIPQVIFFPFIDFKQEYQTIFPLSVLVE